MAFDCKFYIFLKFNYYFIFRQHSKLHLIIYYLYEIISNSKFNVSFFQYSSHFTHFLILNFELISLNHIDLFNYCI